MSDSFVTVRTFRFLPEAQTCQALLESEGVHAFINDGEIVNADWFLGPAVGYIKLQVPESEAPRALELLERLPEGEAKRDQPASDDNRCLSCGAAMSDGETKCAKCGWSFEDGAEE